MRRSLSLLFCLVLCGVSAGGSALAQDKGAKAWLGLIAGPATGSETVLAADMASLFPPSASLRVTPMLGDGGAGNLALLLDDPHVDIAFVSTDALAEAAAKQRGLPDKLELVARLAPQEIHVLARADIDSLAGLAGKQVNFGPAGSASAVTAAALFKALGIKVAAMNFDAPSAIEQLKQGSNCRERDRRRQAVSVGRRHTGEFRHPSLARLVRRCARSGLSADPAYA